MVFCLCLLLCLFAAATPFVSLSSSLYCAALGGLPRPRPRPRPRPGATGRENSRALSSSSVFGGASSARMSSTACDGVLISIWASAHHDSISIHTGPRYESFAGLSTHRLVKVQAQLGGRSEHRGFARRVDHLLAHGGLFWTHIQEN